MFNWEFSSKEEKTENKYLGKKKDLIPLEDMGYIVIQHCSNPSFNSEHAAKHILKDICVTEELKSKSDELYSEKIKEIIYKYKQSRTGLEKVCKGIRDDLKLKGKIDFYSFMGDIETLNTESLNRNNTRCGSKL
jgi:hypothetical protein